MACPWLIRETEPGGRLSKSYQLSTRYQSAAVTIDHGRFAPSRCKHNLITRSATELTYSVPEGSVDLEYAKSGGVCPEKGRCHDLVQRRYLHDQADRAAYRRADRAFRGDGAAWAVRPTAAVAVQRMEPGRITALRIGKGAGAADRAARRPVPGTGVSEAPIPQRLRRISSELEQAARDAGLVDRHHSSAGGSAMRSVCALASAEPRGRSPPEWLK
jgi:hypothetical protein